MIATTMSRDITALLRYDLGTQSANWSLGNSPPTWQPNPEVERLKSPNAALPIQQQHSQYASMPSPIGLATPKVR